MTPDPEPIEGFLRQVARVLDAEDERDLAALDRPWNPWSSPEALWHACPGHVWERFEWARGAYDRPERITRCAVCGAPRCDVYEGLPALRIRLSQDRDKIAAGLVGVAERLAPVVTDAEEQRFRCTAERHHRGEHDFLHAPAD